MKRASVSPVPGDPAFARLQRRYLDGGISLEQYVEEAGRIQDPSADKS